MIATTKLLVTSSRGKCLTALHWCSVNQFITATVRAIRLIADENGTE
jgi:hypothetical protein